MYAQHQQAVSLVLVDMMMPLMDGSTTIGTLPNTNSNVKIVAVSGLTVNEKVTQAARERVAFIA